MLYLVIFYLRLFVLFQTIAVNFIEMAHMYYCTIQMGSAAGLRKSKRVKLPDLCLFAVPIAFDMYLIWYIKCHIRPF